MLQPPSRRSQRPSIYDVARQTGVSAMTVSRVLNNRQQVRESTRELILKAIDEMNYTPSSIARALANTALANTRRTRRIGVLIDGSVQNGPSNTWSALERAAHEVGYVVSSLSIGDDDPSQMDPSVMEVVTQGVEALCVIAPRESSLDLLRQQTTGLPTVVIMAEPAPSWHTVGVNQREGARAAVQHLIELGHRTIAHLAGPMDWLHARERAEGWRECIAEEGLAQGPLVLGDWTSDFGFEFGRSSNLGDTTAVFAANDQIALGVIHGLHGRGIHVPHDISVVGFDDLADARHFLPPLTTVRQDFAALGRLAMEKITAAIEGAIEPTHCEIQPELILRQSTGASARG